MRKNGHKRLKILLTRTLHDSALQELRKQFDVEIHSGVIPMPKKKTDCKNQRQGRTDLFSL